MGYGGGLGNGGGQGLASEAAFRGFERGAALQQQQAHHAEAAQMGMKTGQLGRIREVWRSNLDQEMVLLRELIRKYPYVSMVSAGYHGDIFHLLTIIRTQNFLES